MSARPRSRRELLSKFLWDAPRVAFIAAMATFFLVPLLWMLSTAFKPRNEVGATDPVWIPEHPTLENFQAAVGMSERLLSERASQSLITSLVVAASATIVAVALAVPAAYVLGRMRTRGARLIQQNVLFARVIPPTAIVVSLYLQFSFLHLVDTHIGLIVLYVSTLLPFAIWILLGFVIDLPPEMEEAARVDGASHWQVLRHVVAPLLAPAMVAVGVISFVLAWNEFFFALTFTRVNTVTFPVQVNSLIGTGGIEWGAITATGVIGILPPLLALVLAQRYLVRGLTMGAVK